MLRVIFLRNDIMMKVTLRGLQMHILHVHYPFQFENKAAAFVFLVLLNDSLE